MRIYGNNLPTPLIVLTSSASKCSICALSPLTYAYLLYMLLFASKAMFNEWHAIPAKIRMINGLHVNRLTQGT